MNGLRCEKRIAYIWMLLIGIASLVSRVHADNTDSSDFALISYCNENEERTIRTAMLEATNAYLEAHRRLNEMLGYLTVRMPLNEARMKFPEVSATYYTYLALIDPTLSAAIKTKGGLGLAEDSAHDRIFIRLRDNTLWRVIQIMREWTNAMEITCGYDWIKKPSPSEFPSIKDPESIAELNTRFKDRTYYYDNRTHHDQYVPIFDRWFRSPKFGPNLHAPNFTMVLGNILHAKNHLMENTVDFEENANLTERQKQKWRKNERKRREARPRALRFTNMIVHPTRVIAFEVGKVEAPFNGNWQTTFKAFGRNGQIEAHSLQEIRTTDYPDYVWSLEAIFSNSMTAFFLMAFCESVPYNSLSSTHDRLYTGSIGSKEKQKDYFRKLGKIARNPYQRNAHQWCGNVAYLVLALYLNNSYWGPGVANGRNKHLHPPRPINIKGSLELVHAPPSKPNRPPPPPPGQTESEEALDVHLDPEGLQPDVHGHIQTNRRSRTSRLRRLACFLRLSSCRDQKF